MSKLADKRLIQLLREQNEAALSDLYDQYASAIYGLILREVRDERVALEILRKTFINVFYECRDLDCVQPSLFIWLLSLAKKAASAFSVSVNPGSVFAVEKVKLEKHKAKNIDLHSSLPG